MPTIDPAATELLRTLQAGGELPLHELFDELAELWHSRNPDARSKDLAALLGTRPQSLSQWKSGSDPSKRPPWSAIVLLCELCKRQIVITPAGARLAQLRRPTSS
jgi:hypothetical protein